MWLMMECFYGSVIIRIILMLCKCTFNFLVLWPLEQLLFTISAH